MLDHYRMFAAYNAWANRVLYEEVGKLDDADYRRNLGAFFGSLHGTLNHLLSADRIWMRRFTGEGEAPASLDTILHEDFAGLRAARQAEDARLAAYVGSLTEERIAAHFTYSPITSPAVITHPLGPALAHLFNHQTHHRGQASTLLFQAGVDVGITDLLAVIPDAT